MQVFFLATAHKVPEAKPDTGPAGQGGHIEFAIDDDRLGGVFVEVHYALAGRDVELRALAGIYLNRIKEGELHWNKNKINKYPRRCQ